MKLLTIRNDFHGTSARFRPAKDGTVSLKQWNRAKRKLCPGDCCGTAPISSQLCTKSIIRGPQDADFEDWWWNFEPWKNMR